MRLYEISEAILELQSIEVEGEESLEEAIQNSLAELEMDFYEKVDATTKLINQINADVVTVDNEIKRLQDRKKHFNNQVTSIKGYLLNEMEKLEKKSVKTDLFTLTSVKGREKVIIDIESDLPTEYVKIKMTEAPDKVALLKALKEGKIPGCHLDRSDNSLKIK